MRFIIKHEIKCRVRIHMMQPKMSYREANILQYYLEQQPFITNVKIMERTQNAVICYEGNREEVLRSLKAFNYDKVNVPDVVILPSVTVTIFSITPISPINKTTIPIALRTESHVSFLINFLKIRPIIDPATTVKPFTANAHINLTPIHLKLLR